MYSEDRLSKLILMSVAGEPKFSVSTNYIGPFLLEVTNSTPSEITVQVTARPIAADRTDIAPVMVEDPPQTIAKSKSRPFLIRPLEVLASGRQKVAGIRSKSMRKADYLDAVLSVKAAVRTWYHEFTVSRDLPLRIHLTN
jgi:hypothetical protein